MFWLLLCLSLANLSYQVRITKFHIFPNCINHLIIISPQRSTPGSKTYHAAVVEFYPQIYFTHETTETRVNSAADWYASIIKSDEAFLADIIVFPEGTFNHDVNNRELDQSQAFLIPDPAEKVAPCDQPEQHAALKKISCTARDSSVYVVINVLEKVEQKSALLHYNTNVAFDREGVVVARYRKFNLFNEPGTNVTSRPEMSYFTTDFGVTFGMFICFDILFKFPALDLLRQSGPEISDFAYSAMWFSELPFMSALQTQSMWATGAKKVNLLAAGANRLEFGSTGSGIYSKNGPLTSHFGGLGMKVLVAEVPKKRHWEDPEIVEQFFSKRAEEGKYRGSVQSVKMSTDNVLPYTTNRAVNPPEGVTRLREALCHGNLCCQFELTVRREGRSGERYRHRMVVFDGVRGYGVGQTTGGVFTCALISCVNDTLDSCGMTRENNEGITDWTILELKITGKYWKSVYAWSGPTTLDHTMGVLSGQEYEYKEVEQR